MKELKMPGLEIGSNINGKNLSDPSFHPFYEAAEKLGCALFVHPWEMMGEGQMEKYWLPWLVGMPAETSRAICSMIFGGIFEKFPRLRVAFAHGGGSFPFTLGRIEHGFRVRPDLVAVDNPVNPKEYLGKFWVDSLVHDKKAFSYLVDLVGEDKICLGSDYPFPLGEHKPGRLIEKMGFGGKATRKMLFRNAEKWLGFTDKNVPWFE
jgi:aminocarboxymuconate-semialdehyde decarboxylase